MSEDSSNLLFVYGTLRRGHGNNRLLLGSDFISDGFIRGAIMLAGGIPFVKKSEDPNDVVFGEVYEVSDLTLRRIDRLEGHPVWYNRGLHEVETENERLNAWVYFYPHEGHYRVERVESGDYNEYIERRFTTTNKR